MVGTAPLRALAAALLVASLVGTAPAIADPIYSTDFNDYSGKHNNTQEDTGLPVAFGGTVSGWTGAGYHAVHAVQLNNTPNWAIMFYADNSLTLSSGIAANDLGTDYAVTFNYGTGDYASTGHTQATTTSDGLVVTVLRGNSSVLAQESYLPGAWGPGNYDLQAGLTGELDYTGDGSGAVTLQITTVNPTTTTFGGSLDNLAVNAVPEPASMALLGISLAGFGLTRRRRKAA